MSGPALPSTSSRDDRRALVRSLAKRREQKALRTSSLRTSSLRTSSLRGTSSAVEPTLSPRGRSATPPKSKYRSQDDDLTSAKSELQAKLNALTARKEALILKHRNDAAAAAAAADDDEQEASSPSEALSTASDETHAGDAPPFARGPDETENAALGEEAGTPGSDPSTPPGDAGDRPPGVAMAGVDEAVGAAAEHTPPQRRKRGISFAPAEEGPEGGEVGQKVAIVEELGHVTLQVVAHAPPSPGLLRPPPADALAICDGEPTGSSKPSGGSSAAAAARTVSALAEELHEACAGGNRERIEELVSRGADPNEKDAVMGWTAMHHACNHPEAVLALVSLGADVAHEDDYHMTALHLAAENGAYESVRVLSKFARQRRGSIEYLASRHGHDDICELLDRRWSGECLSDDEEGGGVLVGELRARAVHEFWPQQEGDLGLRVGDVLVLTDCRPDKNWWTGFVADEPQFKGCFPSNYVQILPRSPTSPPPPAAAAVKSVDELLPAGDTLRVLFDSIDRNGDGELTRAELIRALRSQERVRTLLRLPAHVGDAERRAFEAVFQGMDVDTSRCVTFEEFERFVQIFEAEVAVEATSPALPGSPTMEGGATAIEEGAALLLEADDRGVGAQLAPTLSNTPTEPDDETPVGARTPPPTGKALRKIFESIDRNSSGELTRAELIRALRSQERVRTLLRLPAHVGDAERRAFEAVFQGMDVDASRCVTFEEFERFVDTTRAQVVGDATIELQQEQLEAQIRAREEALCLEKAPGTMAEGGAKFGTAAETKANSKPEPEPILEAEAEAKHEPGPGIELRAQADVKTGVEPEPVPVPELEKNVKQGVQGGLKQDTELTYNHLTLTLPDGDDCSPTGAAVTAAGISDAATATGRTTPRETPEELQRLAARRRMLAQSHSGGSASPVFVRASADVQPALAMQSPVPPPQVAAPEQTHLEDKLSTLVTKPVPGTPIATRRRRDFLKGHVESAHSGALPASAAASGTTPHAAGANMAEEELLQPRPHDEEDEDANELLELARMSMEGAASDIQKAWRRRAMGQWRRARAELDAVRERARTAHLASEEQHRQDIVALAEARAALNDSDAAQREQREAHTRSLHALKLAAAECEEAAASELAAERARRAALERGAVNPAVLDVARAKVGQLRAEVEELSSRRLADAQLLEEANEREARLLEEANEREARLLKEANERETRLLEENEDVAAQLEAANARADALQAQVQRLLEGAGASGGAEAEVLRLRADAERHAASQRKAKRAVAESASKMRRVRKEFETYLKSRYTVTIRRMQHIKLLATIHEWRGVCLARGTPTSKVDSEIGALAADIQMLSSHVKRQRLLSAAWGTPTTPAAGEGVLSLEPAPPSPVEPSPSLAVGAMSRDLHSSRSRLEAEVHKAHEEIARLNDALEINKRALRSPPCEALDDEARERRNEAVMLRHRERVVWRHTERSFNHWFTVTAELRHTRATAESLEAARSTISSLVKQSRDHERTNVRAHHLLTEIEATRSSVVHELSRSRTENEALRDALRRRHSVGGAGALLPHASSLPHHTLEAQYAAAAAAAATLGHTRPEAFELSGHYKKF